MGFRFVGCWVLRVVDSSAYRRVRRDSAPAGGSLSFVASNESNQSKDAEHQLIWSSRCGYKGSACPRHALDKPHTCCDFFATRLASHRLGQGKLRSNDRIALGPRGRRRGAQGFGAARDSALRQLTSRRLSERRERSEQSEFGARPQTPSTAEQSALGRPPPSGSPFLW